MRRAASRAVRLRASAADVVGCVGEPAGRRGRARSRCCDRRAPCPAARDPSHRGRRRARRRAGPGHGLPSPAGEPPGAALRTQGLVARPGLHGQGAGGLPSVAETSCPARPVLAHRGAARRGRRRAVRTEAAMTAVNSARRADGPPPGRSGAGAGRVGLHLGERRRAAAAPGLNLADLAHVLDLRPRRVMPGRGGRGGCSACCSRPTGRGPTEFPYDPRSASRTTAVSGTSSRSSATTPAGCTRAAAAGGGPDRAAAAPARG